MSLFCKPISSSFFTNSSKYNLILDILDISRLFKNFLSEEIRKEFFFDLSLTPFDFRNKNRINFYEEQFERIFCKYNFSPRINKTFTKINPYTRQEIAIQAESISNFYLNSIKQKLKYVKYNSYKNIQIEKKINKKTKKEEIKFIKSHSSNNQIFSYLKFVPIEKIADKSYSIKALIEKYPNKKNLYEKIDLYLEKLYKNEKLLTQFVHLMKIKKESLFKKVKLIQFKTGSYQKMAITGTNLSKKNTAPTRHSFIEIDNSNSLYKYFYKFKSGRKEILDNGKLQQEIIRIPLNFNENFHGKTLDKLNLDKPCFISLSPNGIIKFGTLAKEDREFSYIKSPLYAGIDLNLRDNFMSITVKNIETGEKLHKIVEHDKSFDEKLILKYKEIRSYQDFAPEKYKEDLGKLSRIKEFQVKFLISKTIQELKSLNVSHISMEDLEFKNHSNKRKLYEVDEKLTWLESFYRMASVKVWMREQCRKHGIVVSWTPTEFTSQQCSECNFIEKSNRNGAIFICKHCGHTAHSDENSSENMIKRIIEENVSLQIHNLVEISEGIYQFDSKRLGHKKMRELVLGLFDQYAEK